MNVNLISNNFYKNRILKKGLEFAANNGSLFVAGTSLALSTIVRPISILAAPKTDKDNKHFACAKSIASSAAGYLLMLGMSNPVAKGIKKIDNAPEKFLKTSTIKNYTEKGKTLVDSKGYQFVSQIFKLGVGAVAGIPKSIITCMFIPPIMAAVFKKKNKPAPAEPKTETPDITVKNGQNISFKGRLNKDIAAKEIGKVMDTQFMQKFTDRFKDSNFAMHMMAVTDSITTLTFVQQTKANKKIDEKRKNPLIYNALLSTGLSIAGGYAVDKALNKPTEKFIKKFSEVNKDSPKLGKYIEGIKIAKPALIMGGIYYGIIPFVSTYLADRVDMVKNKIAGKEKGSGVS